MSILSYATPNLPFNLPKLQAEVTALSHPWSPHFNIKHYEGGWNVLSLRAPGGKADQIIPEPMHGDDFLDTPLMGSCPSVKELLSSMQCPILSVRLLNLQSGAIIKPHRDHELAFENGEARLHFSVFTNDAVEFYIEEELLRMREGECWYINANLTHSVINKGATDRIHLVIDCQVNDWLKELFESAEKKYVPEASQKEQLLKVISELKMQGTEEGLKLAEQLEAGM
ncbi:MAG: aspartyl/asparaginyl beta-hydroxylase domain-containing protein [Chitinophagaceae bacterium]